MISCPHALASCTIPSWMGLTVNYGNIYIYIFFFFRTPRLYLSWTTVSDASQSVFSIFVARLKFSQFCVAVSLWYLPLFRLVSRGEHRRCVIQHLANRYLTLVDVSRWSYMIFMRAFHGQLSRSFFFRKSLAKIVDIMWGHIGLPSPHFIRRLIFHVMFRGEYFRHH